MCKVLCFLADGFEEGEVVVPVDILRRGGVEVTTAAIDRQLVKGSHGISVMADTLLEEVNAEEYDCVFLPGGAGHVRLAADERVTDLIRRFYEERKYIAAICASPTIFGKMGLLKGRNYTCFPEMNEDFGGTFHETHAVRDGKIITGRAMGAASEFGLLLLETLKSEERSQKVRKAIYY